MHKILVIRLYFILDTLHVSDYISPSSGATFISCHTTYRHITAYTKCDVQPIRYMTSSMSELCFRTVGKYNSGININSSSSLSTVANCYSYSLRNTKCLPIFSSTIIEYKILLCRCVQSLYVILNSSRESLTDNLKLSLFLFSS